MSEKPNIGREAARIETDALTIEIWKRRSFWPRYWCSRITFAW
jgi:hypothetical protein